MESNRKCTAIDLLRAVGYPAVSRAPQTDIVRVLNLILSSEPECVASVGWSATRWDEARKCPVVLRRSMGRFPKDERGKLHTRNRDTRRRSCQGQEYPYGRGARFAERVQQLNPARGAVLGDGGSS